MTRSAPARLTALACLACALSWAAPACAQDDPLGELESWIIVEEETAPEPPLLRLHLGPMAFVEVRSELRADRGGVTGSDLRDLEAEQGLDGSGIGPWVELTLGGKVRGGADLTWIQRGGDLEPQTRDLFFDGIHIAQPGDLARARFELFSMGGFVEWDVFYGLDYRIGLVGGLRYFRMEADLTGVRAGLAPTRLTRRVRGELLSPYFGGLVELTPFPYLSVHTRAQFMNWSWSAVGLDEASYFEFRLGATLHPIPGVLGVGVEYRFLAVEAVPQSSDDSGSRRLDASITANGLAFTLTLSF